MFGKRSGGDFGAGDLLKNNSLFGFSGGSPKSFFRSDNKTAFESIRYIKAFCGHILDSVQVGIGKLDNSYISYS